ncbi:serine/threonine-protein kinase [Tundrisphaera lichenicola]|uniref:serine/threonine-protein kinase n=1 Tax=Tundrisphaera lichenicola TaxID=2029860 RepID=UPI003EB86D1B
MDDPWPETRVPEEEDPTRVAHGPGDSATVDDAAPGRSVEVQLPSIPGFEILGLLGGGGMGVVYQAREVDRGRMVALKLIRGELAANGAWLRRFQTEAVSMARLVHPNILKIHKMGQLDALAYLILEFMPGGSLAAKIGGRPQPIGWSARTAVSIAAALGHMHQRGVLHRDLKPANVLIDEQGRPKVADFGLALRLPMPAEEEEQWRASCTISTIRFRLVGEAGGPASSVPGETPSWREGPTPGTVVFETEAGSVLGTPSYMSPEQANCESWIVGDRSDVYALGAILHEMLLGRPPFRGRTALETLARAARGGVEPVRRSRPEIPPELEAICSRCLEPGLHRRPTAMEVVDDLRRFLAAGGGRDEAEVPMPTVEASPDVPPTRGESIFRTFWRRIIKA